MPSALELRITLLEVRPVVWRRVLVPPGLTFGALHRVIQDAMGWGHAHLHQVRAFTEIGDEALVSAFLRDPGDRVTYEYDFGDSWEHEVELVKVRTGRVTVAQLPWVLAGARSCPPEDCGGPWGYMAALQRRKQKQRSWLPRGFDPATFDRAQVNELMPSMGADPQSALRAVREITPHYRGLRANPHTLGVTLLEPGEVSRPVRVRGSKALHEWLRAQGAARLGELLEAARLADQKTARNTQKSATGGRSRAQWTGNGALGSAVAQP